VHVDQLRARLQDHLAQVRAAAEDNEFVDLHLAELLHSRLDAALTGWPGYDDEQRAALIGAVDYLVQTDDEENDLRSPIGFDDDAEVVEAALKQVRG
jgi:cytochrome P450